MQEVFSEIIEKLEGQIRIEENIAKKESDGHPITHQYAANCMKVIEKFVKQEAEQYNNGWIPCTKQMPPVETEVFILAKRKFKGGGCKYIRTTAMYEDGTVLENDSCWIWEDIEGEWDEENDCYIIPEGWWENRHYNPDDVYNNVIDDEVIAWHPLPEPYQPKGEEKH